MPKIKVTSGVLHVGPGAVLGLTASQSGPRAHKLKAAGPGTFTATAPLQFKPGEEIEVGDLDALGRAQRERFEIVDQKSLALDTPKPARARR